MFERIRFGHSGENLKAAMLEIRKGAAICEDSLVFRFSRSSGPGGQNVNKVNTRVTVFLDIAGNKNFSSEQKRLIRSRLATRVNKQGILRVVCRKYRTQKANRTAAVERLVDLLRWALEKKKVRKKTKIPYTSKQKRLEEKKHRSILKQQRTRVPQQD